jgi:protein TonB
LLPTADVNAIRVFAGSAGALSSPASIAAAAVSGGVPGGAGRGNSTPGALGAGGGNGGGGSGGGTSAGIASADRVDQPPREPAGNAKPRYPGRERELGVEGTVVLRILIDERGRVADVEVVSGPETFRRAVLDVVRTWRFEPARHQGRVVKVWGVKEVVFTHPRNRR